MPATIDTIAVEHVTALQYADSRLTPWAGVRLYDLGGRAVTGELFLSLLAEYRASGRGRLPWGYSIDGGVPSIDWTDFPGPELAD